MKTPPDIRQGAQLLHKKRIMKHLSFTCNGNHQKGLGSFTPGISPAGLFVCLFLSALFFLSVPVFGASETLLEQSGIRYPDGYDVNTVGEIRGVASGIQIPEKGPVRFTLTGKRDEYIVFAAPGWYWEDLKMPSLDGIEVRVTGSKTLGKDGKLYVVAQELTVVSSGTSYTLRGGMGNPLWKGSGFGSGGTLRRGGDQPFRGGGAGQGRK